MHLRIRNFPHCILTTSRLFEDFLNNFSRNENIPIISYKTFKIEKNIILNTKPSILSGLHKINKKINDHNCIKII